MKLRSLILPVAIVSVAFSISWTSAADRTLTTAPSFDCSFLYAAATTAPPQKNDDPAALQAILKKMDAVSASFRTAQAEFEWDNYQKVIDEIVDIQTGNIYYRRAGK